MNEEPIGGYFELELRKGKEYYPDAIKLNSGRNCVKYIISAQNVKKIYLPFLIDRGMTEESIREATNLDFYSIDDNFEMKEFIELQEGEKLLYVNYYSLKDSYIKKLAQIYGDKLIVDNTQAFYSQPLPGIDTFYSVFLKYFGVPDGGYLFTRYRLDESRLEQDYNFDEDYNFYKMTHLLGRIDHSPEKFYEVYVSWMKKRYNQPIKKMSKLSKAILESIDYERVKLIRERNFYYIHSELRDINLLKFDNTYLEGPFAYPLLINNGEFVKKKLIERKIYVPTYWNVVLDYERWKSVFKNDGPKGSEENLVRNIVPLPIDQRYSLDDMSRMLKNLFEIVKL